MEYVRYYPLVGMGEDGKTLLGMTPTDSEKTVREHHAFWLTEIVSNYYRLGARDKPSAAAVNDLRIRCPKCGGALRTIAPGTKNGGLPLYVCERCSSRRSGRGL